MTTCVAVDPTGSWLAKASAGDPTIYLEALKSFVSASNTEPNGSDENEQLSLLPNFDDDSTTLEDVRALCFATAFEPNEVVLLASYRSGELYQFTLNAERDSNKVSLISTRLLIRRRRGTCEQLRRGPEVGSVWALFDDDVVAEFIIVTSMDEEIPFTSKRWKLPVFNSASRKTEESRDFTVMTHLGGSSRNAREEKLLIVAGSDPFVASYSVTRVSPTIVTNNVAQLAASPAESAAAPSSPNSASPTVSTAQQPPSETHDGLFATSAASALGGAVSSFAMRYLPKSIVAAVSEVSSSLASGSSFAQNDGDEGSEPESLKLISFMQDTSRRRALEIRSSGSLCFVADTLGRVTLWTVSLNSMTAYRILKGYRNAKLAVQTGVDGKHNLIVFSAARGDCLHVYELPLAERLVASSVAPSGVALATTTSDFSTFLVIPETARRVLVVPPVYSKERDDFTGHAHESDPIETSSTTAASAPALVDTELMLRQWTQAPSPSEGETAALRAHLSAALSACTNEVARASFFSLVLVAESHADAKRGLGADWHHELAVAAQSDSGRVEALSILLQIAKIREKALKGWKPRASQIKTKQGEYLLNKLRSRWVSEQETSFASSPEEVHAWLAAILESKTSARFRGTLFDVLLFRDDVFVARELEKTMETLSKIQPGLSAQSEFLKWWVETPIEVGSSWDGPEASNPLLAALRLWGRVDDGKKQARPEFALGPLQLYRAALLLLHVEGGSTESTRFQRAGDIALFLDQSDFSVNDLDQPSALEAFARSASGVEEVEGEVERVWRVCAGDDEKELGNLAWMCALASAKADRWSNAEAWMSKALEISKSPSAASEELKHHLLSSSSESASGLAVLARFFEGLEGRESPRFRGATALSLLVSEDSESFAPARSALQSLIRAETISSNALAEALSLAFEKLAQHRAQRFASGEEDALTRLVLEDGDAMGYQDAACRGLMACEQAHLAGFDTLARDLAERFIPAGSVHEETLELFRLQVVRTRFAALLKAMRGDPRHVKALAAVPARLVEWVNQSSSAAPATSEPSVPTSGPGSSLEHRAEAINYMAASVETYLTRRVASLKAGSGGKEEEAHRKRLTKALAKAGELRGGLRELGLSETGESL